MPIELPQNIDLNNEDFQNVWNLIQHTRQSVFLTGKAGTGKSTFLRYICENTKKKYVVLAPTGIAAVNVGGQTLHSFFKIPFKPLLPDDPDFSPKQIRKTQRFPKEKVKLLKELELIIIDEISMVRADIIDFVDKLLKIYSGNMREPFGGKQLLFVGDIFQLEPVVTRDMREILSRFYKQFFFFNAHVFGALGLIPIELRKIYRQKDDEFISMLDRVRVNAASWADMALLNSRCDPNYSNSDDAFAITLATRRDTVNAINDEHMAALKTPEFSYQGQIEGEFPENDLPTALTLVLKEGAQVIFIRNDKDGRWVNGTIGKVNHLSPDKVWIEMEDGEINEIEPEAWENIQYSYDEKKKVVVENVLGSFSQFPIKPAWALTVHKSQGLTFNHVVIDFAGGAFTGGQTYVALSRCTSLDGITLLKPLSGRDIIVHPAVVNFSRNFNNQTVITDAINQEKANQLYRRAIHAFDHNEFATCVQCIAEASKIKDVIQNPVIQRYISVKLSKFDRQAKRINYLEQVVDNQRKMLRDLAQEYCVLGEQSMDYGNGVEEGRTAYGNKPMADEIGIKTALANFKKALRIFPECVEAMIGLGNVYMHIDEKERARNEYESALKLNPNLYLAHISLGNLYDSQKNVSEAIKCYKRAIKSDKKRPEPHDALETIYERLGLDDLAEEHHEIAKQLRNAAVKPKRRQKRS